MTSLALINSAIAEAFSAAQAAGSNVVPIAPKPVEGVTDGTTQSVRVDTYDGGFQVVGTISFPNGISFFRITQHGPQTDREKQWPTGDIAELAAARFSDLKNKRQRILFLSAKSALQAIFSSLPAGPQAQFSPVETAIVEAAKAGNWTLAAEILSTAVVPESLAQAQTAMVTALAPYLTAATALAAATTISEVNAIAIP